MCGFLSGSTKNLKHDEEKPHAAGSSKTKKKRKSVLNSKLEGDEKEPHAAGSKKKKDRTLGERLQVEEPAWKPEPTIEDILQVKEPEEEPGWKWKTVKFKLTMADLKHFEEYTPSPPYRPSHLDSTNPWMINAVERAAARHQAHLERRNSAVQLLRETGSAEFEVELLDDLQEDNGFAEIEKAIDNLEA